MEKNKELDLDKILVKYNGNVAHIPREEPHSNIPLCGRRHGNYTERDPETWKLWSWDNRRLCKECKEKYIEQKEFMNKQ